jgi:hypothetical protein
VSSPLLSDSDAATIAAEIVMLRNAIVDKTILILEGPSDEKLLGNFIREERCEIVISWGCENALGAMQILRQRTLAGVLCIVDSDYDEFLGKSNAATDVLLTDEHDLETMLIRSKAFDKVLRELASNSKLANLTAQRLDARLLLRDAIHPLGILRLYSLSQSLYLKFEGLRFRFLDRKTMKSDVVAMVKEVYANSQKVKQSYDEDYSFISYWQSKEHDPWRMCCGHDLAVALGKALQSFMGTQNAGNVSSDQIESRLRLAYRPADFRNTKLFEHIRAWEKSNAPFVCLIS